MILIRQPLRSSPFRPR